MDISFLLNVFTECKCNEAITNQNSTSSYGDLLIEISKWRDWFNNQNIINQGEVVSFEAEYSAKSVALLLVLIESNLIIVPLAENIEGLKPRLHEIAQVEKIISLNNNGKIKISSTGFSGQHTHYSELRKRNNPGLVLFSSGSTGERKGIVHDFYQLLQKYRVRRHCKRTITFFLLDHIAGIDTLFYTLSNGGFVVTIADRQPESVCKAVEKFNVEVLPVSPTFINLLLLSEIDKQCDLSSLEYVTYGSEVMPSETLKRLCSRLPRVIALQKYGLSEIGALRSKSEANDSVWVKLGGEDIKLRVVDGLLEIKAPSTMLGYLNAESPFTIDGWFKTGDAVEAKGDYFKILGRQSEQINIGGEKVYPTEVESILSEISNVKDVSVSSKPNPIIGQILVAKFKLRKSEDAQRFRSRVRDFCKDRVPSFMTPQKIIISDTELHSERYKKLRV